MTFAFIDFYFSKDGAVSSGFNIWQLVYTVSGAVLSAIVAYAIFILNQNASNKRELRQRQQQFADKLNYFKTFLSEMPFLVHRQWAHMKRYAYATKKNPSLAHSYTTVEYSAIERFVDIKSHEYFLSSFLGDTIGDERQGRLDKFKSFYNKTQFYYKNIDLSKHEFERRQSEFREAVNKYRILIGEVDDYIADLYINKQLLSSHSNIMQQVFDVATAYRVQQDNGRLDNIIIHLVKPLFKIIIPLNGGISELHILLMLLRKLKSQFEYLIFKQQETSAIFDKYAEALKSEFKKYHDSANELAATL